MSDRNLFTVQELNTIVYIIEHRRTVNGHISLDEINILDKITNTIQRTTPNLRIGSAKNYPHSLTDYTSVSCPRCAAPVGKGCVTISGKLYSSTHKERKRGSYRNKR